MTTLLEISGRVEGRSAGVAGGFPAEWVGCITDYGIGFLVALLPSAAKPFELFKFGGVPAEDVERASASVEFASAAARYRAIISLFPPMTDEYRAMTINSLMVVLLENAESDMDARFIYGFLAESAIANPEVFSLMRRGNKPSTGDFRLGPIYLLHDVKQNAGKRPIAGEYTPSPVTKNVDIVDDLLRRLPTGQRHGCPVLRRLYGPVSRRERAADTDGAGGPPLSTLMTITPDDVASGVNTSVSGIQPSMLSANVPAVNFLNELGFKGLAEMGSFNCITRSIRMSNSRLVAIVVRMVAELVQHVPDDKDISSAPVRLETEE
ncbi:hypothetical protein HK101_006277 [Irineochytrium annulatum]|nr:hypothetical protein HK101_006277 [Irineochytrium annulatum]